jgi:hypothetical protein
VQWGGAKGNGWVAGTAGRMLGVLFSGGSIPAARSEASRELSRHHQQVLDSVVVE